MKNLKLSHFLTALMVVLIFACDTEENGVPKREQSENMGFTGILPDNLIFGEKNITSSNHVSGLADSTGGMAYLTHYLNICDSVAGNNIQIRLPFKQYSNNFNPETEDLIRNAQLHYSYDQVKSLLSPGEKPVLSLQEPDFQKGFMVLVSRNSSDMYANDLYFDQDNSTLKVIQLTEGTESDPTRGQVKTMYITFEADLHLHPQNANYNQAKKFKGLLRMKYREI